MTERGQPPAHFGVSSRTALRQPVPHVKVSFLIPLYNQLALTRVCLDGLQASADGIDCEIILADNGSTDGTREFLATLRPPFRVVLHERNLGYAAANNRAARLATGEFLALLNNDLILAPGWLGPMLAAFAHRPDAGVVGNIQLDAATGEIDHAGVVFHHGGYPVHFRRDPATLPPVPWREFPAVTAACCVVRRDWFLQTGGFDESYVNGFEDSDLCLRARQDGRRNYVANRSVVRHHISSSAGRGAHEHRNALRFLRRWEPLARALEKETALRLARETAAHAARGWLRALPAHPFRFRPALFRHHRAILRDERRRAAAAARPVRVAVDLERLQPGSGHGGVKPFVYTFLAQLGRDRRHAFEFRYLAPPGLRAELAPLLRARDRLAEIRPGEPAPALAADVLYCPLGFSRFARPGLPGVHLIVDVLHRDYPDALPIEEINFRHEWFARIAREGAFFQCNSRHVVARFGLHYGVHPSRCFHTYNVVQDRLPAPPAGFADPALPAGPFFFYPANFWVHKNHETLLLAYRLYRRTAADAPWPLVLTGHPDERMASLRKNAAALGLAPHVRFAGHLDDARFAGWWSRAGALVFPSLHEGFGIPLLEAMRFGVPVISSEAASLPEVGGHAVLFADARAPLALAEAMRRVAAEAGLRADLAAQGRLRLADFSLELEASRLAHHLHAAALGVTP